jgi:hypothetical protein
MKWLKILGTLALIPALFAAYLLWPIVFPRDPNELIDITLKDGAVERQFRIKRGYLNPNNIEPVTDLIVMTVGYPDMGLPPPWKQGEQHRRMQVSIEAGAMRVTTAEAIVRRRLESGRDNASSFVFDYYKGELDGYEVYETLPNSKTGDTYKTLLFKDHEGTYVSNRSRGEARMLGDLIVQYGSAKEHRSDPRQMRIWAENFIRQLVVPPLPPLSLETINKLSKK